MHPLSGAQVQISAHGYVADVATVGATLRGLSFEGRDLITRFDADRVRPNYFGAVLVPWPNRITDGVYEWEGTTHELPLTEPQRHHALHGLACWLEFTVEEQFADRVVLCATVPGQAGYPFALSVAVEYIVGADGLTTRVTAVNEGSTPAPYGTAPHPYLMAGTGHIDEWTLTLRADSILNVTPDRLIPTELVPVSGEVDFREPRLIGAAQIDNAFTGLARGDDGRVVVRLEAADGHGTEMSWGEGLDWVQIFTADFPVPEWRREAVAVEPMTCPPDAFNTREDLIVLEPQASHTAEWVISAF